METPEAQTKINPALIQGLTFLAGDNVYAAAQTLIDAINEQYGKVFTKNEVELNGAKAVSAISNTVTFNVK